MQKFLLITLILTITNPAAAQPGENVSNGSISLAVIPGEGDRQPSDIVIANLEVGLSALEDVTLVDRSVINKVLQEIHLGESGFQNKKKAVTIGNLVAANILLFVEKTISSDQEKSHTETDIVHIRLVESRTGIILGSFMETADMLESGIQSVVMVIQSAIIKQKIPIEDRKYVGIMGMKNNEPGTSLDGAAEALKMFLAIDLAKSPNVIMLDRKHLQYLQTEKALTGTHLKLKFSTFVIDGGLQYEQGQNKIIISVFLRPLSKTGNQSEKMSFTVDKNDLKKARELISKEILNKLNVEGSSTEISQPDKEGDLFLAQVPLYLFSGDLETAVSHAEVAYAILSTQEARYWAAWAWYALGWNLVDSSVSDSFRPGVTNIRRVNTVGDQFVAGNTKVMPLRRRGVASGSNRINNEFWGKGSQPPRRMSRGSHQMATRIEGPRTIQKRTDRSAGGRRLGPVAESDVSLKEKRVRFLSALMRSYSLMEEMIHVHARDYEAGAKKNIILRDPRDNFENVSRHKDRQRNLALKHRIGSGDKDALWLFEQLVQIRNKLNGLQRNFYFRHYTDSLKAQTSYWETWKDKTEMIEQYYRYDPKLSAEVTQEVVDAFVKTSHGEPGPRIKGLIDMFVLGRGRALSPDEKTIYLNLTKHEDPFIRFVAHKQLMRVDPIAYSKKTLDIFVREFHYGHTYRKLNNTSIIPDFIRPVFHRMAISRRQELLPLAEKLFEPMIKGQDMVQIVAWRDCLWPYINGLELDEKKDLAQAVVSQVIEILEQKNYRNFSPEAKLLRAQLDLKLVQLGVKKDADTKLARYFAFLEIPYYIRLRPELEAPRLNDGPIDISSFSPVKLPTGGLNTTTNSKTKEIYKDEFSGSSFAKGYALSMLKAMKRI